MKIVRYAEKIKSNKQNGPHENTNAVPRSPISPSNIFEIFRSYLFFLFSVRIVAVGRAMPKNQNGVLLKINEISNGVWFLL